MPAPTPSPPPFVRPPSPPPLPPTVLDNDTYVLPTIPTLPARVTSTANRGSSGRLPGSPPANPRPIQSGPPQSSWSAPTTMLTAALWVVSPTAATALRVAQASTALMRTVASGEQSQSGGQVTPTDFQRAGGQMPGNGGNAAILSGASGSNTATVAQRVAPNSSRPSSNGATWNRTTLGAQRGSGGAVTDIGSPSNRLQLGGIRGDSGAMNRSTITTEQRFRLGAVRGDSGAITRSTITTEQRYDLGAVRGDSGAIHRSTVTTEQRYKLGAIRGDSGAITRTSITTEQRYDLGAVRGDSGAITRVTISEEDRTNLYFRRGDSGAIDHGGGNQSYRLGAIGGDSGAITRVTISESDRTNLYYRRGDSGAIDHGGGNSDYRLGVYGGDSGVINRQNTNPNVTLGGRTGNPGVINHGGGNRGSNSQSGAILHGGGNRGSTGTSGSIHRPAGSGNGSSGGGLHPSGSSGSLTNGGTKVGHGEDKPREVKPPPRLEVCCGEEAKGTWAAELVWEINPVTGLEVKTVRRWELTAGNRSWSPSDAFDYIGPHLIGHGGSVDSEYIGSELARFTFNRRFSHCVEIKFDHPDPKGRIVKEEVLRSSLAGGTTGEVQVIPSTSGVTRYIDRVYLGLTP